MPSSQLESQSTRRGTETQDAEGEEEEEEEEQDELADGAAGLSLDNPISDERVNVFRRVMGQLMDTELFEDDSAGLGPLIEAVNAKVGGRNAFSREEAVKALKVMDERNMIM